MTPDLWLPINRRTARDERRRRITRTVSQVLPWLLIGGALTMFAHMALSAALAIPELAAQAELRARW